jgi:hypothetical protein
MSIKHFTLKPGDTLVVTSPQDQPAPTPPPPPTEDDLEIFLTIDAVNFYQNKDGSYCQFKSDLDICNDGSGPEYGDPHHQAQTAYYSGGIDGGKYLNADKDKYIVVPPQVRAKLPGVVMGCRGKVTNLKTLVVQEGVVGEIGPDYTSGECAYCLAKIINPMIEHNSGDKGRTYLYELWPDVPARDGNFTYKLQPA